MILVQMLMWCSPATAHEVSHDLAPQFLQAGCVVFDLSGAFRVNDRAFYEKYYGFTNQYPELLEQAVYGLAEWNADKLNTANLIAVLVAIQPQRSCR